MTTLKFQYFPDDSLVGYARDIETYLYIAPVQDHHAKRLHRMERLGTGGFKAEIEVPDDAVGSFVIAPVSQAVAGDIENATDTRIRWRLLSKHVLSCQDPGVSVTPEAVIYPPEFDSESGRIFMPEAPARPGWPDTKSAVGRGIQDLWKEQLIDNRPVWLAGSDTASHLLILFDAQQWIRTPLPAVLERLHRGGELPEMRIVAVDTASNRLEDLGCSESFADWVVGELLDHFPGFPANRVVAAGQSLGGLTATNIARLYPDRISRVVGNSASFWWPEKNGPAGGAMLHLLNDGAGSRDLVENQVKFYFSAGTAEGGSAEPTMVDHMNTIATALEHNGIAVKAEVSTAAHEMAAWEGALTRGLLWHFGKQES